MIQKSLAMRGLTGTMLYAVQWPFVKLNEQRDLAERNAVQSDFDSRHGTDTAGILPLSSFNIENPNWVHGVRYAPTSPQGFQDSLALLGFSVEQYREFTFVDIGAGKGATLLYAADLGFKAVVGIEFVDELHQIAVRNLAIYPTTRDIGKSICADAATCPMPEPPVVAFFNYPFSSEQLMGEVVANIGKCGAGPKYLLTLNYPYDPATLPNARLRLIKRGDSEHPNRHNYAFEML